MLAGNFESFHSSVESESCRISCTIKGPSDPEQFSCAQVSEATQPITKTWLMDRLLVSVCLSLMLADYVVSMNKPYHLFVQNIVPEIHGDKTSPSL